MRLTIAIDAMGGDLGPQIVVEALEEPLKSNPNLKLMLFGDQHLLSPLVSTMLDNNLAQRVEIHHSPTAVSSSDKPSAVLRSNLDSSMAMAIKAVADGSADTCISGGNTGALMAMGMLILGTAPNISRPAVCAEVPTQTGRCLVLDLGANVDCSATQLHQFAELGAEMASRVLRLKFPAIKLLNVGTESVKGNALIKQTDEILRVDAKLNYQGFIEGHGVFAGEADVVVCDGFSGNIALKIAEGVANLIAYRAKQQLRGGWIARFLGWLFKKRLSLFKQSINPALFNGAFLLGLQGTLIKSHGGADMPAFRTALEMAVDYSKSLEAA